MRWTAVRPDAAARATAFLTGEERFCVAAISRFLDRNVRTDKAWLATGKDGEGHAFLFLNQAGFLFPVLDRPLIDGTHPPSSSEAAFRAAVGSAMARILGPRSVRAIQGSAADVELAACALGGHFSFKGKRLDLIDYDLMEREGMPEPHSLRAGPSGLVVRRALPSDADRIFPLQRDYELEEVVPPGGTFNPAACRLAVDSLLSTRIVLAAELEGELAGKANINASAFTRDQIGGVYVLPRFRGRGIGTRLSAELSALIAGRSRRASLFVKKGNPAAIAAYRRAGFGKLGDYRIVYIGD